MMGVSRTRSAGAKVTDEEYAQLEVLAQARGLTWVSGAGKCSCNNSHRLRRVSRRKQF